MASDGEVDLTLLPEGGNPPGDFAAWDKYPDQVFQFQKFVVQLESLHPSYRHTGSFRLIIRIGNLTARTGVASPGTILLG